MIVVVLLVLAVLLWPAALSTVGTSGPPLAAEQLTAQTGKWTLLSDSREPWGYGFQSATYDPGRKKILTMLPNEDGRVIGAAGMKVWRWVAAKDAPRSEAPADSPARRDVAAPPPTPAAAPAPAPAAPAPAMSTTQAPSSTPAAPTLAPPPLAGERFPRRVLVPVACEQIDLSAWSCAGGSSISAGPPMAMATCGGVLQGGTHGVLREPPRAVRQIGPPRGAASTCGRSTSTPQGRAPARPARHVA
jgi:hypothetical protein